MSRLRVAFVVQGEGRGHMTQALALGRYLRDAGHEVTRVLVGRSPHRSVPDYFTEGFEATVEPVEAPVQVPGSDGRALSRVATALDLTVRLPGFVRSAGRVRGASSAADVVVSFLEPISAFTRLMSRSTVPTVAVAHHYLFLHPELRKAPRAGVSRSLVLGYTRATALRSDTRMALSFRPMEDAAGLRVAPPLLRPGLDDLPPSDGGFLLAYALNAGYGDLLAEWHRSRPDVRVVCYLDGGEAALRSRPGEGFRVRPLDQRSFLESLASCRAYVGSAGFESLCEAYYLGKPVLTVPTQGQHEQVLNAWDAERQGVARWGGYEDLTEFWERPTVPPDTSVSDFRAWVARAPEMHVEAVEEAASRRC